jgi:hypothetical protein
VLWTLRVALLAGQQHDERIDQVRRCFVVRREATIASACRQKNSWGWDRINRSTFAGVKTRERGNSAVNISEVCANPRPAAPSLARQCELVSSARSRFS